MRRTPSQKTRKKQSARHSGADATPVRGRTLEFHSFFEQLLYDTLDQIQAGHSIEKTTRLVLSKLSGFTGSVAAALYRIEDRTGILVGDDAFPEPLRRFVAQRKLTESHLRRSVNRKTPGLCTPLDKKSLPVKIIHDMKVQALSFAQIPVIDGTSVVGVVELIAPEAADVNGLGALFQNRVRRIALLLLEQVRSSGRGKDIDIQFRPAMDAMTDGICIVQDLKIVYVNDALKQLFGYEKESELEGNHIRILISPEDQDRVIERSRNRFTGKKVPNRYEYRAVRRNGTKFDVEVVVSVVEVKGAEAVIAVHRDITLRKAIEKELQQSEQMFRNVIDGILTVGDALVVTNLEGKVLQVNSEFERLTGIKKSDALGKEFPYAWLLEEEMARYVLWVKELRERKSLRDFDIHWKNLDGTKISVSMNTTLLYNALGRPVAMMNMARDITQRKSLEEENRLQFERLRVLYELSSTLTSLLRISEIADAVHRHLQQVFVFDSFFIDLYDEATTSVRNVLCYDIVNGVHTKIPSESVEATVGVGTGIAKVISARKSLLEVRSSGNDGEIGHPFGDKSRRSQSLIYVPMFSKDKIIGVLSIQSYLPNAYDDSHIPLLESFSNLGAIALEKAKLYEETISKSLQLQNRNKELDDFTYVVSHDLKEPLITVEGYSRILLKEHIQEKNASASEYIHSIIQACARMKNLIDDLLVLSRVSRLSELMETVSLGDVVTDVADDLKFSLQEKRISLVLPERYPSYYCNPTQIKLVMRNLISNAIKFNKSDSPFIKISIDESDKRILCSIQDNGIGIEKRFFDKIFVIFQRLNSEYEGSGAGLAIVKKIIELYQGQIWLESQVGQGTTFYFSLPK